MISIHPLLARALSAAARMPCFVQLRVVPALGRGGATPAPAH